MTVKCIPDPGLDSLLRGNAVRTLLEHRQKWKMDSQLDEGIVPMLNLLRMMTLLWFCKRTSIHRKYNEYI